MQLARRLPQSQVAQQPWMHARPHAFCIQFVSSFSTKNSPSVDKIMANVVQGPSLVLTSLHRPEPTLMLLPGLRSLPFWTNAEGQVAYQDSTVTRLVQHLQHHAPTIREEYLQQSPNLPSDYCHDSSIKSTGTEHTLSSSTSSTSSTATTATTAQFHTGSWDWHSYLLHGQVQHTFCETFPQTTRILQDLGSDLFTDTPFGFCFFSKLAGQSSIPPHASPINFRLRLHLPLVVPTATATTTSNTNPLTSLGIRVGPRVQSWIPNQPMVLDDSYLHSVWNETNQDRVVLLVDLWHPDVQPTERREIVQMFRHAQQQGWIPKR